MADRLTPNELNKMNESVRDMTDLSKKLRIEFEKISNETDVLSNNFKNIIEAAKNNNNIAEKYLIAQKTSSAIAQKINELKSKSSYLDSVGLKFKREETFLQMRIAKAQIQALESQVSKSNIDKVEREKAINALKIQNTLRLTELQYYNRNSKENSKVVRQLQEQREESEKILRNINLTGKETIDMTNVFSILKSSFLSIAGTSGLIVKDLGKLGEYIQNGITPATLIADIIKTGYENFKAFDKAAVSVRSNLGALPGQANRLESLIKQVGIDSMHLGATFEDVGKSITAISEQFTSLVAQDKSLLMTTTALAKQFGIAESTSVKFLKTLGGISGNSAASQKSMIGFAQKMAQAAGVPLGKIMQDVADASDDVRVYVGSSAVSMIKAATAARMMGIDLNKAASSAEKLLQFESSIASELKASALLGQNINFNYARQLSFNKDIIGANKEILKIAKQVNFNQLNPIQQKAFADAAGKSVGELQDMLQQEKNIALVKNGTNEKAKKALADYERMVQLKDEEAKKEGVLVEKEILRKLNQEKLAQLQNQFNQMMSELAVPVMEVVNGFLTVANIALPVILKGLLPISGIIKSIQYISSFGNSIRSIFTAIMLVFPQTIGFFDKISSVTSKVLGFVSKFSGIFKIFGTVGRFLGPIGLVINAFMFINNLVKRFQEFVGKDGLIVGGLKAVGYAIRDTLLQPFIDVYDWIMSKLGANSPSEIGLSIVKGLVSVSGMILDALVRPFIMGYNLISKYIPGMSEVKMPSEVLSDLSGDAKNTKAGIAASSGESALVSAIQTSNQQLVAKMDQLMTMMANGGIAVNLDGQRVNAALSKTTYRSGGFGQATSLA
jgi:hypothetical protein